MTCSKFLLNFLLLSILIVSTKSLPSDNLHSQKLILTSNFSVCWHEDKKYSQGSIIKVGDFLLVCAPRDAKHLNDPLIWKRADDEGFPIKLDPVKTIRVN